MNQSIKLKETHLNDKKDINIHDFKKSDSAIISPIKYANISQDSNFTKVKDNVLKNSDNLVVINSDKKINNVLNDSNLSFNSVIKDNTDKTRLLNIIGSYNTIKGKICIEGSTSNNNNNCDDEHIKKLLNYSSFFESLDVNNLKNINISLEKKIYYFFSNQNIIFKLFEIITNIIDYLENKKEDNKQLLSIDSNNNKDNKLNSKFNKLKNDNAINSLKIKHNSLNKYNSLDNNIDCCSNLVLDPKLMKYYNKNINNDEINKDVNYNNILNEDDDNSDDNENNKTHKTNKNNLKFNCKDSYVINKFYNPFVKKNQFKITMNKSSNKITKNTSDTVKTTFILHKKKKEIDKIANEIVLYNNPSNIN